MPNNDIIATIRETFALGADSNNVWLNYVGPIKPPMSLTEVEPCENLTENGGSWDIRAGGFGLEVDNEIFKEGTGSIRINGGSANNRLEKERTPIDLSGFDAISIWVRRSRDQDFYVDDIAGVYIRFGGLYNDHAYWEYALNLADIPADDWVQLLIPLIAFRAFGPIEDWTNIHMFSLDVDTVNDQAFWIDAINAVTFTGLVSEAGVEASLETVQATALMDAGDPNSRMLFTWRDDNGLASNNGLIRVVNQGGSGPPFYDVGVSNGRSAGELWTEGLTAAEVVDWVAANPNGDWTVELAPGSDGSAEVDSWPSSDVLAYRKFTGGLDRGVVVTLAGDYTPLTVGSATTDPADDDAKITFTMGEGMEDDAQVYIKIILESRSNVWVERVDTWAFTIHVPEDNSEYQRARSVVDAWNGTFGTDMYNWGAVAYATLVGDGTAFVEAWESGPADGWYILENIPGTKSSQGKQKRTVYEGNLIYDPDAEDTVLVSRLDDSFRVAINKVPGAGAGRGGTGYAIEADVIFGDGSPSYSSAIYTPGGDDEVGIEGESYEAEVWMWSNEVSPPYGSCQLMLVDYAILELEGVRIRAVLRGIHGDRTEVAFTVNHATEQPISVVDLEWDDAQFDDNNDSAVRHIEVQLETDGTGNSISTIAEVVQAINDANTGWIVATVADGSLGTDVVEALVGNGGVLGGAGGGLWHALDGGNIDDSGFSANGQHLLTDRPQRIRSEEALALPAAVPPFAQTDFGDPNADFRLTWQSPGGNEVNGIPVYVSDADSGPGAPSGAPWSEILVYTRTLDGQGAPKQIFVGIPLAGATAQEVVDAINNPAHPPQVTDYEESSDWAFATVVGDGTGMVVPDNISPVAFFEGGVNPLMQTHAIVNTFLTSTFYFDRMCRRRVGNENSRFLFGVGPNEYGFADIQKQVAIASSFGDDHTINLIGVDPPILVIGRLVTAQDLVDAQPLSNYGELALAPGSDGTGVVDIQPGGQRVDMWLLETGPYYPRQVTTANEVVALVEGDATADSIMAIEIFDRDEDGDPGSGAVGDSDNLSDGGADGGAPTSTRAEVVDAIRESEDASSLVIVDLDGDPDGIAPANTGSLVGGSDDGNVLQLFDFD